MYNNVMNMNGNFKPFRVWCQHVLPSIYDDSLSYMELLNKVVDYINQFGDYLDEFSALNAITYEGVWDITKSYKAWSVVTVNSEAGYVSIKPVPAGIPITNTEYWQLIADYTAIIAGLAERVVALEAEDVVLDGKITTVNNRVTTVDGRVDNANTAISNLDTALQATNATVTQVSNKTDRAIQVARSADLEWADRTLVFLGDSYMTGWSPNGTADPTFVDTLCANIGNDDYYVYATGGVGFSYARGTHYYELFARFMNEHPTVTPTDVFIIGGYNDNTEARNDILNSVANPYNAQKTFEFIRNAFPNVIIHVAYIGRGAGVNTARSGITAINNCAVTYQMACRMYNADYIAKSELMLHNYAGLSSDGIHPNQSGHNAIGNYLADVLQYGYYQYEEIGSWHHLNIDYSISGTNKTNLLPISGVNWNLWEQLTNEGVVLQGRKQLINFVSTPISSILLDGAKNTASITLGKICGNSSCRNYICNFLSTNEISIPMTIYIGYSDNGLKPLATSGSLLIDEDGTISLVFITMKDSYSYPTISNIIGFTIPAFTYTIPLCDC